MSSRTDFVLRDDYANVSQYVDVELMDGSDEDDRGVRCDAMQRAGLTTRLVVSSLALAAVIGAVSLVVRPRGAPAITSSPESRKAMLELDSLPGAVGATVDELKPIEVMNDGNVCDNSEELYAGLCYKKCALLTSGVAAIRTSSWTCCKSHPCTLSNQLGSVGTSLLCNGYDIGGDGSCPHKPGACLVDEELHLGVCYKKCSILTRSEFPNRISPATCCKTKGLGCLDFRNDKTNPAFDVGGGQGDHDPSTLADAHLPQKSLTESGSSEGLTTTEVPASADLAPSVADLRPVEHMHDGNVCADNEELYGGLCYGKCAVLTKGEAPIRTSSWTCCESHPCGLWNQRGAVGTTLLCNGYDVSGDGSCPHKPGACLENEELHLGICYEKCSVLTDGEFPHRFAAASCCKVKGLGCLNFRNVKTSPAFDKGGGGGGVGDRAAADAAAAHGPLEGLTEEAPEQPLPPSEGQGAGATADAHAAAAAADAADVTGEAQGASHFVPAAAVPAAAKRGLKSRRL